MFARDVAPGVHRIAHADVNVYLVEDEDGVTVVDSGFPATFAHVERALRSIGRAAADVRAVVLTHAHFDHVGSARRMRRRWQVPIWAHRDERFLAAHPYRYKHERNRLLYPIRYPACLPVMGRMVLAGALGVRGVDEVNLFDGADALDVPGDPLVLHTPGHTFGHCALYLPDRDAVIAGDAIVTLDPYTAARGPQIVSGAATADSSAALASLSAIADTGATHLLPGHGEPWHGGAGAAVELALRAGPS
jgi:glyoxylase-like metal-dependent hydrolase (beta-lactamase superfamily II)